MRCTAGSALLSGRFGHITVEEYILTCPQMIASRDQIVCGASLGSLGVHGAPHDQDDDTADDSADKHGYQKRLAPAGGGCAVQMNGSRYVPGGVRSP